MSSPAATASAGRYVGQSVKRREDPRLLTGRGRYVDDVPLAHALHAAFVRSNVARGRVIRVDTAAAKALPGVRAVFTADDLNSLVGQYWFDMMGPPPELGGVTEYAPTRPLAAGDVRFVGDPIAIVIADDRYIAEDACELVDVEIEQLPALVDMYTAAKDTEQLVNPECGTNVAGYIPESEIPGLEDAFKNAAHVVTRRLVQCRATNVPMEGRGIMAKYDQYGKDLQIWAATQSPHGLKGFAARLVGMPESRVRVTAGDVGGGFGQKMMATRDEAVVILAAFKLGGHAVKWVEDRRESLISANSAREEAQDVSFAVDAEGKILAARVHFWEDVGAMPTGGKGQNSSMAMPLFSGPYKIPLVAASGTAVFTNTCGKAAYRGPWAMETICREQMMDHVAHEIGLDPFEFRRRNIIHRADLPFTLPSMLSYDESVSAEETLDQATSMLDLNAFRRQQADARAAGRLLGVGVAVYIEPSAIAFGILNSDGAVIKIDASGKVQLATGTGSHGHSVETTIAQVVAEALGCDYEDVVIVQGDTDSTPVGPGTGGSRTAVIVGGAAQRGSLMLREKVLGLAAHMLEASTDDLEINSSFVSVKGTPTKGVHFAQIAGVAYQAPEMLPEGVEMGLEVVARYKPPSAYTWSNATHVCTVEVDPKTGMTKILRYIVSEDCGKMINPMVVEGQITGGVAQGIGGVLYEHMVYDNDGNPLATTFMDYLLPTADTVPEFEIGHIETPSPTLGGFKGMGEGGAIGSPPAVANAIHDALAHLNVHPAQFPLGPSQISALLSTAAPKN